MKRAVIALLSMVICGQNCGCSPVSFQDPSLGGTDSALVGTWEGTAQSPTGTVSLTARFDADGTYSVTAAGATNFGSFSTDNSKSPAWINVYNQHGQNWHGLYQISGTTLRWSESTGDRPTSLDSAPYRYTLAKVS